MSVVFERQLNNIKEGLHAINQMKVSMESLKGSDSNLMREGILQIQEANQKLSITQQAIEIIKAKSKNSIVFKNGIKSAKTLITQLKILKALLGDLYTKTKAIVFGGIGILTGGFNAAGSSMSNAKNKASVGKGLGIKLAQLKSLERVGKLKTGDESFYVNAFKSIKDNATSEGSANFATLGLNYTDFANMSDPNLMFKEFNKIALRLSKMKAQDKEPLEASFKAITGLSSSEFYDKNIIKKYNEQYEGVKASGLGEMASVGESFDKMIMEFQNILYAIVSKLAPFIKQISDAFSKGLRQLLANKDFQNLLESFGRVMEKVGTYISAGVIKFFEMVPTIINKIKSFFNSIYSFFEDVFFFIARNTAWLSSGAENILQKNGKEQLKVLINKGDFNVNDLQKLNDRYSLKYVKDKDIKEILSSKYKNANKKDINNFIDLIRDSYDSSNKKQGYYNDKIKQQLNLLNATINIQHADGSVTQTTQQITIPQGR